LLSDYNTIIAGNYQKELPVFCYIHLHLINLNIIWELYHSNKREICSIELVNIVDIFKH